MCLLTLFVTQKWSGISDRPPGDLCEVFGTAELHHGELQHQASWRRKEFWWALPHFA